jgi:large subunit ribosomal protein L4e
VRKEVNEKERRLALASAIAATADSALVSKRGHKFSSKLPIIVSDDLENLDKVRDLKKFLTSIGADKDLQRVRARTKKTGASYSKLRRTGAGPLFVVGSGSKLWRTAKSLEGVSVARSSELSILDLAPGSFPGRLTIWTRSAIQSISKPLLEIGTRYAS